MHSCQNLPLPINRFNTGIIPQVLLSHQKYGRVKTCGPQVATSLSHQEPCLPYGDMKIFCNTLHEEMVTDLRRNNEVRSLSTPWAPRILPHVNIHCLLDAWWPATELLFSVYYPLGMNIRIVCRPAWRGCDMAWKGTEGGGEIKLKQKREILRVGKKSSGKASWSLGTSRKLQVLESSRRFTEIHFYTDTSSKDMMFHIFDITSVRFDICSAFSSL